MIENRKIAGLSPVSFRRERAETRDETNEKIGVRPSILRLRVRAANARHHMFLTRGAGVSIKPGVELSGTPGTRR